MSWRKWGTTLFNLIFAFSAIETNRASSIRSWVDWSYLWNQPTRLCEMSTERWRVLDISKRPFHLNTSEKIEASQGPCLHGWSHILTLLRRIESFQQEVDANDDLHCGLRRQSQMGSRWDQVDVLARRVLGQSGSTEQKEGRQRRRHLSAVVLSRQERSEWINVDRAVGSKGYSSSASWKQWKFSLRSDPRDQKGLASENWRYVPIVPPYTCRAWRFGVRYIFPKDVR